MDGLHGVVSAKNISDKPDEVASAWTAKEIAMDNIVNGACPTTTFRLWKMIKAELLANHATVTK